VFVELDDIIAFAITGVRDFDGGTNVGMTPRRG
jgi:hypothetical protein